VVAGYRSAGGQAGKLWPLGLRVVGGWWAGWPAG
jgi:hypothetical protein